MKAKLSAIVLTRNVEELMGECLDSLKWADEVVVVDSGSTDKTVDIAKKHDAKIFEIKKGTFSDKRNLGAKKAKGEWLLYVDADERVTPLLRREIESRITRPHRIRESASGAANHVSRITAYAIPRRNILLGKEMRHGGWWPDYVLRLMKKSALKKWKGELHEQPEVKGRVGKLENPLIHKTHRNLTEMVEKTNEWSEIEAALMFEANHPKMNIFRFFSAMFREFWYRGVKEKGFLDGPVGIIEIIYQVFSRFVSYAKLWETQLEKSEAQSTKS